MGELKADLQDVMERLLKAVGPLAAQELTKKNSLLPEIIEAPLLLNPEMSQDDFDMRELNVYQDDRKLPK